MQREELPQVSHISLTHRAQQHPAPASGSVTHQIQPYAAIPLPVQSYGAVPGKTPGIAVLLSFLWLGAGHLYCNKTTTGIVLIFCELILLGVSLIPFGLVVTLPIWLIAAPIVMVLAAQAARDFNARNGIPVR